MSFLLFIFKTIRSAAGLLLFAATAMPSHASILWSWNYSTSQATASGTFVTASIQDASGGYLITGITGMRNGTVIEGLQAPGSSIPGNEPYTVDDLVYLGPGPQLTSNGFGFILLDGTFSNPFYADFLPTPEYLEFFSIAGAGHTELPASFAAAPIATPEPATLSLVSGALGCLAVCRRARRTPMRYENSGPGT